MPGNDEYNGTGSEYYYRSGSTVESCSYTDSKAYKHQCAVNVQTQRRIARGRHPPHIRAPPRVHPFMWPFQNFQVKQSQPTDVVFFLPKKKRPGVLVW